MKIYEPYTKQWYEPTSNKLTKRQWIGVACMWISGIMIGAGIMMGIKD